MKRKNLDMKALRRLHQQGDFIAARDGYLAILSKDKTNIEALHNLGILYAQNEDFENAVFYFDKAIAMDPDNATLYLNLGNVLKEQELFSQAAEAFNNAISKNPYYPAALNNLGTVLYIQNKIEEAISSYQKAIEIDPGYLDAYYNLGLAYIKQNENAEAIQIFEKLLAVSPQHAAALFQLARLMLSENRIKDALKLFSQLEEQHPYHFETQTNIATCYLKLGALNEAKKHYLNALTIIPNDTQILFNLGVICMEQGYVDHAIQYYQRAAQVNPDYFAAHNNLGVAFLATNHIGYALQHFKEALRLEPNNKAIQYTVAMLSKDQRLLSSPSEYIKNLFDAYADHYEPHLLQSLEYRVPELLLHAVKPFVNKPLDILDLGCGTGLCGEAFKILSKKLIGVDLSQNMLDIAANKEIYDELINAEFGAYLEDKSNQFDLILSGDALVYIGDLKTIFNNTAKALRDNGFFAFNTETTTSSDEFVMNQSGRFSHNQQYLNKLAQQHHLEVIFYEKVITRQQNNEPVYGHLYVLKKS